MKNEHRDELIDTTREFARPEKAGEVEPHWTYARRNFLKSGLAAAAALAMPLEILGGRNALAAMLPYSPDYGPLAAKIDETTGLQLLNLPDGFRYKSYGWTGDVMTDGIKTPGAHDGMAVCGASAERIVLVRNHELTGTGGSFGPARITYDPVGIGGCTSLGFDARNGNWTASFASIAGTINNCAGGPTPWNSWLTCEENVSGPLTNPAYTKQHGYVYEVPAFGVVKPVAYTDMGAFVHEAVAIDPATGIAYETEDQGDNSGFYRFLPAVQKRYDQGGKLQMLKVVGVNNADLRNRNPNTFAVGTTFDIEWVDIANPNKPYGGTPATPNASGVFEQGFALGGARFRRGEGAWYGNGVIYWISTNGGPAGQGLVWRYDPRAEKLTLIYTSPSQNAVNSPDNCAWSPRGSLIICEDGGRVPQKMHGLTADGVQFPFCENNVVLAGFKGFNGDFRSQEFAGATFHNEWLFVNIQTPGITFAITGPWDNGAL